MTYTIFTQHKNTQGFTLLEMIVAVSVFSVAAILGVSSYLALTAAQKKALTLQSIQDNLRFAVETMSRDIRAGSFYYCGAPPSLSVAAPWNSSVSPPRLPWDPQDCPSFNTGGGRIFTFVRGTSTVVVYRARECTTGHFCIERGEAANALPLDEHFIPITSADIEIGDASNSGLIFYVVGSEHGDGVPGRATLFVHGTAHAGRENSTFDIQTSVSQIQFLRGLQ